MSGQRRYDTTVLYRLAIIQRARQLGFTLSEIRYLFFGFRDITRASERWRTLSHVKLAEFGSSDGWNKSSARRAQKADDEVSMRHLGSMWQSHVSQYEQKRASYASDRKPSTSP
jgi:DNA-binding transcriptional MerR regulator